MNEIVYGRKKPIPEYSPVLDAQNKLGYGIKDNIEAKRQGKNVSLSGDVIFKDMQFFKPEGFLIVATAIVAIFGVVMTRFLFAEQLGGLKQYMSQQAMDKTAELVGQMQFMSMLILILPLAVMLGLFMFKFIFFMPTGHKSFVIRAWRDGMFRLSVEKVKDNKVKFEAGGDADEVWIGNKKKNWDFITGKPVILLEEGEPENTFIHKSTKSPEKLKDINTIKSSIFALGRRVERYNLTKGGGFFSNPTNILLIFVLIAVIVVIVLIFTRTGGSGGVAETAQGLVSGLTTRSGG